MPQLVHGERVIVGYDHSAIATLIESHLEETAGEDGPAGRPTGSAAGQAVPPGNSLDADQHARVATRGNSLSTGLSAMLDRIGEELEWNDVRGSGPYRLGMHDGLRFAQDAVATLLQTHGHTPPEQSESDIDA